MVVTSLNKEQSRGIDMYGIENAIQLMRRTSDNYWIGLKTSKVYSIKGRIRLGEIHEPLMVLRYNESDYSLRNIWNRNNEVYEWIPFHKVYGGFKIYTTKYDNKYFVKIYSPDKSYEVYHVRSLDDATVEKLVKSSL